jgi:hypothetical protein
MRSVLGGVVILAAACGDDGDVNGPGRFDAPADFDRTTCRAGAMQGLDPQGIYAFTVDYGDAYGGTSSARLDVDAPGRYGGLFLGSPAQDVRADDDDLFFYRRLSAAEVAIEVAESRSMLLCDRDGVDLRGLWAYCVEDGECFPGTVRARKVERLDEAPAQGLTEIGNWDQTTDDEVSLNVRVADDLAFVVRSQAGLQVLDVADPAAIRALDVAAPMFVDDGEYYNDVKLVRQGARRFALVSSNRRGMVVYDVTTPTEIVDLGSFGVAGDRGPRHHTLFVDGNLAYLANLERGLEVWDISALPAATLLDTFFPAATPDGAFLHDLYVEGPRAYLNVWTAGMVVADVSDPADVVEVGRFADYGETTSHSSWVTTVGDRRVAAHGDEQWGSHLRLVDVTESSAGFGRQLGEWQTRPEVSAHNVMAFGSEVIMSHYQDGIRILDISEPASPRLTAWFNTWPGYDPTTGFSFFEGAIGLDVDAATGRIYVADSHRDLVILQR